MEELKPNGPRRPKEVIVNCHKCYSNPCRCNVPVQGLFMGDMLNTGIPGGLDGDFSTPV